MGAFNCISFILNSIPGLCIIISEKYLQKEKQPTLKLKTSQFSMTRAQYEITGIRRRKEKRAKTQSNANGVFFPFFFLCFRFLYLAPTIEYAFAFLPARLRHHHQRANTIVNLCEWLLCSLIRPTTMSMTMRKVGGRRRRIFSILNNGRPFSSDPRFFCEHLF